MKCLLFLKYNLRALCHGDLKSPSNDFKPPNQSSLPNSEDQECHGDLDYDGEESDIAISSEEEECT